MCALVLACGCLGAQSVTSGGPGTTPSDHEGTVTSTTPTAVDVADYEVDVSDHGDAGNPAIEGGIRYATDEAYTERYYVTTVATAADARRFNHSVLPPDATAFVRNTSFETATLVVVQAFPASSRPDYRVESVRRRGGTLEVGINDSSVGATADITVETVLLRVPGRVDRAEVTTEDGVTVASTAGVVTPPPTPTSTPAPSLADLSDRDPFADGGDLRVENGAGETVGYDVTVEYYDEPACRDETPACGEPGRWVSVNRTVGKLPSGAGETLADLATVPGTYRVRVTADLSAGNGSRRDVTESFTWRVDDSGVTATVVVTGDGPTFSTGE